MKKLIKLAAVIAAMGLALSFVACDDDDDDDDNSITYIYTCDLSYFTAATEASTNWTGYSYDVDSYYTGSPDNAFLIIFTYDSSSSWFTVCSSSDWGNSIEVSDWISAASGTYALVIYDSTTSSVSGSATIEIYSGVSVSGSTVTATTLVASDTSNDLFDYSGGLYIAGENVSDLAVYCY